jgi:hypothetical protein
MLFQETPPDTSGYMIAGYVIAFLIMALYVTSIYLRNRNLKQDITLLQEMDQPASAVETDQLSKPGGDETVKPVTKKSRKK